MSATGQNRTAETTFTWTGTKSRAAFLCAEDVLTDEQIADDVKIKRSTLSLWKKHPDFESRIAQHVAEIQERVRTEGLGRLDKRKAELEDTVRRINELIEARGADMAGEIPGGETGLLVRQYKSIGTGPNARQVTEYPVDAALLREKREYLKQIAQDAGQWSEKRELSGPNGGPIPITTLEVVIDPDLVD